MNPMGPIVVAHRNRLKLWPPPDTAPVIEYAPAVEGGEGEVGGGDWAFADAQHGEETLPVPKPEAQDVVAEAPLNEAPLGDDARLRVRDAHVRETRIAEQPRDYPHARDGNAVGNAGAARDAREARGLGVGQESGVVDDAERVQEARAAPRVGRPPRGGARPIAQHPLRQSTRDRHPPRRFGDEKMTRLGH